LERSPLKTDLKTMPDPISAVENKQPSAAPVEPEAVKAPESPAAEVIDYEKEFSESLATIAKLQSDNENYKKGILRAKGKLPPEDEDIEENPASVKIAEELVEQNKQILAMNEKLVRDTKELRIALQNKAQISNTTPGTGSDPAPFKAPDNLVSPQQLTYFKSRGWSDTKIEAYKKNLLNKINS
jgi:hypothetical protein